MGKYSKAIGSLIGSILFAGVTFGFFPETFASAEMQGAISAIIGGVFGTFFSPKNED